jgi:hypothetical protein
MKVKLLVTAKLLGTEIVVHKGRIYKAVIATNQPDYKEAGKIFIVKSNGDSILLKKGEYQIV